MSGMTVRHVDGDRFTIGVRDHLLTVDQPVNDGGADTAPTPTELFVAGLASCVAFYARRYLSRHQLPTDGLTVTAQYTLGLRPARVTDIRVDVQLPDGVPGRAPGRAARGRLTLHRAQQPDPPAGGDGHARRHRSRHRVAPHPGAGPPR